MQTGSQLAGRPSIGAWLSYGIGRETEDLPAFVVMISPGSGGSGQPLYDRLWGSGFLPSRYQGVKFRSVGDPVLYLSESRAASIAHDRREFLDALGKLNQLTLDEFGDPEISTRIAQYEMAFRMQSSVPELTDLSKEPRTRLRALRRRTRRSRAPSPPTACWRAAWPSAACASSSSSIATGTTTATCRSRPAEALPGDRPGRPPR